MAEIEAHIPTVPYGYIRIAAPTSREVRLALEDPETEALRALLVALRSPRTPDEVLPEEEALESLKEALGASEAVENSPEGLDAKAAFLTKFGKGK
jgi:hypothetical protein